MDIHREGSLTPLPASGTDSTRQGQHRPAPRYWSTEQKKRIVAEAMQPGASVAEVARRHDVNANQVFNWCKKVREAAALRASKLDLVPVGIIAAPAPEQRSSGAIEIQVGPATIKVDASVDEQALRRVLAALRASA